MEDGEVEGSLDLMSQIVFSVGEMVARGRERSEEICFFTASVELEEIY